MSSPEMENTDTGSTGFDPARWLWLLDKASPQLMTQLANHGQLLHLQWQQEKRRLQWIMLCSVLSVSFVFLALLFTGFALLYLNKDNEYFAVLIWALPLCFTFMAIACFFIILDILLNFSLIPFKFKSHPTCQRARGRRQGRSGSTLGR